MNKNEYVSKVYDGKNEILTNIKRLSEQDEPETHEDYCEPLSIDSDTIIKILLSYGGPEDGFKLYFGQHDEEPYKGFYYRADWGEYEEAQLSDEELDSVFNFYLYGQKPEGK